MMSKKTHTHIFFVWRCPPVACFYLSDFAGSLKCLFEVLQVFAFGFTMRNLRFSRRAADLWERPASSGASRGRANQRGRQHMLVSFPGDLDERQDFVKFTQLYKTGQNGKGDHRIVWRHFLKRVTLIQRSIMEYQYFIYCSFYITFYIL